MSQQAQKTETKPFDASKYRVGIVVAEFNAAITERLLAEAFVTAERYKVLPTNITVHQVPGSVEIPVVLRAMAETKKYDALVALGAIIRGETDHYDYVAKIVSEGVLAVMMSSGVPVGFGVLTCENENQALARTHVGADALVAALRCATIISDEKAK